MITNTKDIEKRGIQLNRSSA